MKPRDKVLFVCSHTPAANAPEAGHKTAWRNIERLAGEADVDILLVTNEAELRHMPAQWPANARLLDTVSVSKLGKLLAVLTKARRWSPRFAARLTPAAIAAVRRAFASQRYDRVWLEFTECAGFLDWIPADVHVTVSAPDVLIQWALRNRSLYRYLAPATFDNEQAVLTRANQVVAQSPKDADLIRALYSINHVSVEMPALAPFVHQIKRDGNVIVAKSVLFWGAMSRAENSRAALRFLDIHWPVIVARHPDATLYIVGSGPPAEVSARATERVVVTGFVEDPSRYFAQACVGVAPLEEGAGIKVKVLEMLAAGIPVISTPVGAEGISAHPELHVCDFGQFAAAVLRQFDAR